MLEALRGAVKSWVAQLLLGLLVVSFAIWGIGDVASGFSTKVATVGEREIEADAFARVLRNEQQRFGIDPSEIRSSGLDRFVLGRMVREAAFEEAMRGFGVSAPDSAVAEQARAEPAFQVGGQFDPTQYAQAVRRAYGAVPAYEETVRRALASAHLMTAAVAGAAAPPGVAEALARQMLEARRFDAITLTAQSHGGEPPAPSDAELSAYLAENAAAFALPERRDATWLHIDPAAMAGTAAVDEADIRALYDARSALYVTPETRLVDQIVYPTEAEAQAARGRLDAGEADFDALLAERGLSRDDAALGPVTRADLPDARADSAFGLDAPGVAGPARTATGFALLDVLEIDPGATTPYEAVREELRREIGAERARPDADRLAEQLEDLRAGGATLEEAAAELGLSAAKRTGLVGQGAGVEGVAAEPAFLEALFATEAGDETDLIRLDDGGYLALRADAVTAAATPPLDAIRDAVADSWRSAERRKAMAATAEAALSRLKGGETLEAVAADLGAQVVPLGPLRRGDPDPRLGEEARRALFTAPPGVAALTLAGERATLAVLREVVAPADIARETAAIEAALAETVGQDQLDYLGRALEAAAGVRVNQQAYDSVLSGIGG